MNTIWKKNKMESKNWLRKIEICPDEHDLKKNKMESKNWLRKIEICPDE